MKKKVPTVVLIAFMSIISMLPMITKTNIQGHDTTFHIANIEALSTTLQEDFFHAKISTTIGSGFGYGTHLFYPMLPHLTGAAFNTVTKNFSFSTFDTLTLLYTVVTFLSGLAIYSLSKKLTKNSLLAFLSVVIFLFMPYRLGDIIVRSAFNEVFTFLFMPLVLLALLELMEGHKKKFFLLFVLGYTGLLYSHLVISLYFTLFLLPFAWIYRKELFQKESLQTFGKAVLGVTLLVLPLLFTMLEHRLGGNYLVFQENYLSGLTYVESFNNTGIDYLLPKGDYSWDIPMYINIVVIVFLLLSSITYFTQKEKKKEITFLWVFSLLAFIVSLSFFPWKYVPSFLYMIQFAWRTETMLVISLSLLAPLCILQIKNKQTLWIGIGISLVFLTSIPLMQKLSTHTYLLDQVEPNYGMGHSKEYLLVNTYQNMEYFDMRSKEIIVMSGNAYIEIKEEKTSKIVFSVNQIDAQTQIEFPRLYYLGYELTKDKEKIPLEESPNGFLQAEIDVSGTYTLEYKGTVLTTIGNILFLGGILYILYEAKKR